MQCEYFGTCASCSLYKFSNKEQLTLKINKIKNEFKAIYSAKFTIIPSLEKHFRSRKEFSIKHEDNQIFYAMNNFDKKLIKINSCQIVNENIYKLMPKLLKELKRIKDKLFAIEFLSGLSKDTLVSLIYHKKLDENWEEEAIKISKKLGISIIGRSKKQKLVIDKDYIIEKLNVNNKKYIYKHIEGCFTQANSLINEKMLSWSIKNLKDIGGDLLELYCGIGNFTLVLSKLFNKVLATEISKTSIRVAKENAKLNNIKNINFIRMSSEDFSLAFKEVRKFNRLKNINLKDFNFKAVLVDPPRAGLDKDSINIINNFEYILYISCNPKTLIRDLNFLLKSHKVLDIAFFDQFAYTKHLEMGIKLKRIKNV